MAQVGKPLKDWTFGEAQEECLHKTNCYGCSFYRGKAEGCTVRRALSVNGKFLWPINWEFENEAKLTEPELAICRVIGGTRLTRGNNDEYVLLWGPDGEVVAKFVASKFPSVQKGTDMEVPDG